MNTTNPEYQNYYAHIDEITLEQDTNQIALLKKAPLPYKKVAKTSAQIRFLDQLEKEKKITVIDTMVIDLWKHGVDPAIAIESVQNNDYNRAADCYQHWMYTMMSKQIVANATKKE